MIPRPVRALVVPAAGTGSRLGSSLPKVLHPVAGRPMLAHLAALHGPWVDRWHVVVRPSDRDAVAAACAGLGLAVTLHVQPAPIGMLDAVLRPLDAVRRRRARTPSGSPGAIRSASGPRRSRGSHGRCRRRRAVTLPTVPQGRAVHPPRSRRRGPHPLGPPPARRRRDAARGRGGRRPVRAQRRAPISTSFPATPPCPMPAGA